MPIEKTPGESPEKSPGKTPKKPVEKPGGTGWCKYCEKHIPQGGEFSSYTLWFNVKSILNLAFLAARLTHSFELKLVVLPIKAYNSS